jgi:hypothetical protein
MGRYRRNLAPVDYARYEGSQGEKLIGMQIHCRRGCYACIPGEAMHRRDLRRACVRRRAVELWTTRCELDFQRLQIPQDLYMGQPSSVNTS